ncbi:hypothetical protein, partial [Lentimonas sp. CC8]|uniref:hypothetical protein n=1 Tax=Lentimonas sp. CC8 TaxID=2676101 RepID=UPI001A7EE414
MSHGVTKRTKPEDSEGLFTYLFMVFLEPIARCGLPKESPYEGNPESSCLGFVPLCLERSGRETSQMQRAETSSWIRYAWARRWGSVLRSKDSRYGFGALARWPKP